MNLTEINSIKDQVAQKHGYSSFSAAIYATCMKSDSSIIDSIVSEAMHLYAESKKPKWISVKDELPEHNQEVIVINNNQREHAIYRGGKFGMLSHFNSYRKITHWQPLPEAPLATEE